MADFNYEIVEELGSLGFRGAWETKVRKVSWNGAEPKIDIRPWNEDDTRMGKGVSLSEAEAQSLLEVLKSLYGGGISSEEEDEDTPLTHEEMLKEIAEQEGY